MTDLKPKEPIEVRIDYKMMFVCIFAFAVIFWVIGSIFRHYPIMP